MPQIVIEYGLIQPTENVNVVDDQVRRGHALYNELADIEHAGRRRIKRAECAIPALAACHGKLDAITARINLLYDQKRQSKSHDACVDAPDAAEIDAAKDERAVAKAELRKTRKLYREQLDPIEDEVYSEYGTGRRGGKYGTRAARALKESGVYWGTYLKILAAFQQACTAKTKPFMADGRPRKIIPWEERPKKRAGSRLESGLVAVHIQNRVLHAEGLFGNDTFIRIDPLPENAFDPDVPRGQRKKLQRTMLHLRVGSDGRRPIWATWPLFMHRALPRGDAVQRVEVLGAVVIRTLREQRFRHEWKLQLTLEVPNAQPKLSGAAVAVNLGWRRMHGEPQIGVIGPTQDGELRAATWADTAGGTGEVRLGASFRERIRRSWRIRSERDKLTNALRAELRTLDVPCSRWRSPRRFHKLLAEERAREGTPEYAEARVALLTTWARRDWHLYWFERGCREGALNYRRDVYRRFALRLAQEYKAIVIEGYDIRDISENADMPKGPSVQRVESAPSVTKQIIRSTGARLGCAVVDGESKQATQKCHVCGDEQSWDAAPAVMHTCANGHTWDQDENNALNMLASAAEMLKNPDALAAKKPKRSARFARRHKKNGDEK
jgi:hypothetical protein